MTLSKTLTRISVTTMVCLMAIALFLSCNGGEQHTISAKIKGLDNDTVFINYYNFDTQEEGRDTIIANNNKFVYDVSIPESGVTMIILQPKKTLKYKGKGRPYMSDTRFITAFIAQGDKVDINGSIEPNYITYQIKNSALNEAFTTHRQRYKMQDMEADTTELLSNFYRYSKQAPPNQDSLIKTLDEKRNKLFNEIRAAKVEYIKAHLDSDLSAYYMLYQPVDTFDVYYHKLAESIKTGIFAKQLKLKNLSSQKSKIKEQAKQSIVVGADAPDFTLKNIAGEDVSLSSLKGKYIVLDFWGSWCGWCIKGAPQMKEYYDKYKAKVEFVGIACDDKDADWRKAVETHKLNWVQLMDDESDDITKNISARYGVSGYPTKIILDKDQKIVAVIVGESEEFYKKLDELLK